MCEMSDGTDEMGKSRMETCDLYKFFPPSGKPSQQSQQLRRLRRYGFTKKKPPCPTLGSCLPPKMDYGDIVSDHIEADQGPNALRSFSAIWFPE